MIKYKVSNGSLVRAYPSQIVLAQITGLALFILGGLIALCNQLLLASSIFTTLPVYPYGVIFLGLAVLLGTYCFSFFRWIVQIHLAGSYRRYRSLRLMESQTHVALKDAAVANLMKNTKFVEVSCALACFDKQSKRTTITIKKLAGQTTEDLVKFAEILSACLVGRNQYYIVQDYWLSEDNTQFTYLLDNIQDAKARQLVPESLTDLRTGNDYCIKIENGLCFSMVRNVHLLVVGPTGSSKTTFLKSFMAQLFLFPNKAIDLKLIDVKSEFASWAFLPKGTILSDTETIVAYFEELLSLVIERERQIAHLSAEHDLTGATFADFEEMNLKVCIIEEYAALLTSIPDKKIAKRVQELLLSIVSRSRSSGVFICLCMQQPRSDLLGTAVRDNFGVRICLSNGSLSDELARMVFGSADNIDNHAQRFTGYLMTTDGQMSTPRLFHNINLHEHQLERVSAFREAYALGKSLRAEKN